jgi:hypothetical protein
MSVQAAPLEVIVHRVPRCIRHLPANRGQNALPEWRPKIPKSAPSVTISKSYVPPSLPKLINNPFIKEDVQERKPSEIEIKTGESWETAAFRAWYAEKIMPKRMIRVTIGAIQVNDILIVDAGGNVGDAKVINNKDTWVVELPVKSTQGFVTHEVVEYTKKEVDDILMQEARVHNKIDITGGGQKIEYVYEEGNLLNVVITLHGIKR